VDQQRVWLAVGLSLLLLVLYQEFVVRPYQTAPPGPIPVQAPAPGKPVEPIGPEKPVEPAGPGQQAAPSRPVAAPAAAERPVATAGLAVSPGDAPVVTVETDLFLARLTSEGARLAGLELEGYRRAVARDSPALNLVDPGAGALPLTLQLGATATDAGVRYTFDKDRLVLSGSDEGEVVFKGTRPDGSPIEKRLRFRGDSYLFDLRVDTPGPAVGLVLTPIAAESAAGGQTPGEEKIVTLAGGKLNERTLSSVAEGVPPVEQAMWSGFTAQYFAALGMPREGTARVVMGTVDGHTIVRLDTTPESGGRYGFELFYGPKERKVLAPLGHDLSRVVDYGYFWFIAIPLLKLLELLHRVTGNYGIDIILLTTLVKIVTIPLTQTSFRSMKAMQKLQPEMLQLRERYKDDQTELQKKMMELYKRHKVNPLSGCLPMLLQIPIFVGLYNALMHAIELRHAPFMLWINDLSAPDRLMVAGVGIPVLTLLMGASMLLQQWMSPQQGDPTQQKMMMIMPVVFTFMFINFPAGLVLYWLVNNILTIGQQYWMLRSS